MSRLRRFWSFVAGVLANPLSAGIALAALAGGLSAGAPASDALYDYVWRDARFCDDCHIHDYANENWARSVHGELTTCHDCHRVPLRHYPRNLYGALFDRPDSPEDVSKPEVPVVICEQCHADAGAAEPLTGPMPESLRARVPHIDASPLHRAHLDAKERPPGASPDAPEGPIGCVGCHGGENQTAHTFEATSATCDRCHGGIHPVDAGGGDLACLDCHGRGFVAVPGQRDPGPAGKE